MGGVASLIHIHVCNDDIAVENGRSSCEELFQFEYWVRVGATFLNIRRCSTFGVPTSSTFKGDETSRPFSLLPGHGDLSTHSLLGHGDLALLRFCSR